MEKQNCMMPKTVIIRTFWKVIVQNKRFSLIILSFLALFLIALTACEPLDVPVEETVPVEDNC